MIYEHSREWSVTVTRSDIPSPSLPITTDPSFPRIGLAGYESSFSRSFSLIRRGQANHCYSLDRVRDWPTFAQTSSVPGKGCGDLFTPSRSGSVQHCIILSICVLYKSLLPWCSFCILFSIDLSQSPPTTSLQRTLDSNMKHSAVLPFLWPIVLQPSLSAAYWRTACSVAQTARVDPILSPGAVSGHVHKISGGSST